jgi:hypothetical protein
MNQSRPRWLWRDGVDVASEVACADTGDATLSPPSTPADRAARSPSITSIEWDGRAIRIIVSVFP